MPYGLQEEFVNIYPVRMMRLDDLDNRL